MPSVQSSEHGLEREVRVYIPCNRIGLNETFENMAEVTTVVVATPTEPVPTTPVLGPVLPSGVYRVPSVSLVHCALCRSLLRPPLGGPPGVIPSLDDAVLEWVQGVPRASHALCFDRVWAPVLMARRAFLPPELYAGMVPEDQARVRQALESGRELDKILHLAPSLRCTGLFSVDFTSATYTVQATDKYSDLSRMTAVPRFPLEYWYDAYTLVKLANDTVPFFASKARAALTALVSDDAQLWFWYDETAEAKSHPPLWVIARIRADRLKPELLPRKADQVPFQQLYQDQQRDQDLNTIFQRLAKVVLDRLELFGLNAAITCLPWTHRLHLYPLPNNQAFAVAVNVQYDTYDLKPGTPGISVVFGPARSQAHLVLEAATPDEQRQRNILYHVPPGPSSASYFADLKARAL